VTIQRTRCARIGLLLPALLAVIVAAVGGQARPTLKSDYVKVNGVRLHYVAAGEGPLILFLHGFPEFWYAWKNQLVEFGKDHRAVAPDLRGFNLSEKPRELDRYGYSHFLEDIRALGDHFSPNKRFVLVGHDVGGALAWRFANAHPERLEKLVIVNAPHPSVIARLYASDPAQRNATQYTAMYRSAQAETTLSENNYAYLVNRVMGAGLRGGAFTEEDKREYLRAWSQPGALTGGLNYYRANRVGPPTPGQDTPLDVSPARTVAPPPTPLMVNVRTLVIWGEKDIALLPQNLDGLELFVPVLTVKRIPDGSHWVVHEKAVEVNAHIREFIR
jgi:epoxide hydrolase 4